MRPMIDQGLQVMGRPGSRQGVHVLALSGAISSSSASALHDAVSGASCRALILDMGGITHVDSTAVGGLVRAYVSCQKSGRKLALAGLNRRVLNVLSITGVEPLFEMFATVEDAENSLA